MSLFMSLDCPHCLMSRASHTVLSVVSHLKQRSRVPYTYELEVSGKCAGCGHCSLACIEVEAATDPAKAALKGDLSLQFHDQRSPDRPMTGKLLWQAPDLPSPSVPPHLPDAIERAFLDAEKAFSQGIWSLAAGGYRKAVERAISPLLGEDAKGKMLGPKIGMLERTDLLPPAMLDWIRIVKDDGNFALHDDDQDFDSREEVEPAREFAFTLLTYLYSLPEKVRIARNLPSVS